MSNQSISLRPWLVENFESNSSLKRVALLMVFDIGSKMVRERGIEPPRLAALVPKTSVYTSFTTRAYVLRQFGLHINTKRGAYSTPPLR